MTTFRQIIALGTHNGRHTMGAVVCLVLLVGQMPEGQKLSTPPLTIEAITTEIGNPADAQGVISTALTRLFPPPTAIFPTKEFFLSSQVRDEWFPAVKGIEFVRLSEPEAAALLASCGTYWMVNTVDRSDDVVSIWLSRKCGAGASGYRIAITALGYSMVGAPGSASGYAPSPDCPCL